MHRSAICRWARVTWLVITHELRQQWIILRKFERSCTLAAQLRFWRRGLPELYLWILSTSTTTNNLWDSASTLFLGCYICWITEAQPPRVSLRQIRCTILLGTETLKSWLPVLPERQAKKSLLSSQSQPPNHVMQKRNKQILDSDLSGQSHALEAHWTCNNAGIVCR